MKTNKPGTVTQQPLFGCTNCYEDFSYPADHLHVYNGECWCEICWEEATHEIAGGIDWGELKPFRPALKADYERLQADHERLQAECEELRQEVEALQGIQPEMPPMPPNGKGLPRYGVRWNGPTQPLSVPKDDGYWTPWHLAQAECEKLRAAIRRLCNIYVVDVYYRGEYREQRLDRAVNRAIDAATQEVSHDN